MDELVRQIREFARQREWEQYHSPKNLSMALSVEVAEIVEIFQWMTEQESQELEDETLELVKEEIGDVMIYLTGLADKFQLDPVILAKQKLKINARKYPADMVRGKSKKYTRY